MISTILNHLKRLNVRKILSLRFDFGLLRSSVHNVHYFGLRDYGYFCTARELFSNFVYQNFYPWFCKNSANVNTERRLESLHQQIHLIGIQLCIRLKINWNFYNHILKEFNFRFEPLDSHQGEHSFTYGRCEPTRVEEDLI